MKVDPKIAAARNSSLQSDVLGHGIVDLLEMALGREADEHIQKWSHLRSVSGKALVVRKGAASPRTVVTDYGTFQLSLPRIAGRLGAPAAAAFSSRFLPRYARRLHARGSLFEYFFYKSITTGDPTLALVALVESPAVEIAIDVARNIRPQWKDYAGTITGSDLRRAGVVQFAFQAVIDDVGRASADPSSHHGLLIALGVDASGRGRLLDVVGGRPERTADWMELIRRLQRRGLHRIAGGDLLPGFPAACMKAMTHVMPDANVPWFELD